MTRRLSLSVLRFVGRVDCALVCDRISRGCGREREREREKEKERDTPFSRRMHDVCRDVCVLVLLASGRLSRYSTPAVCVSCVFGFAAERRAGSFVPCATGGVWPCCAQTAAAAAAVI